MKHICYVLKTDTNDYVAIDHDSGGYPYKSSLLTSAKTFGSLEEVLSWRLRNDKLLKTFTNYTLVYEILEKEA